MLFFSFNKLPPFSFWEYYVISYYHINKVNILLNRRLFYKKRPTLGNVGLRSLLNFFKEGDYNLNSLSRLHLLNRPLNHLSISFCTCRFQMDPIFDEVFIMLGAS
jgi:hypothetical protein